MKGFIYIACLCFFLIVSCVNVTGAPGDTTWVYANNVQMTYNGNYDSTVFFPAAGVQYRKIYMIFTLGKYMCPTGSTYCGDWDYTVDNYLMTPRGDTLDLGRFITPYANAGAPRTPWTWHQNYVYDITDYARVLSDSGTVRIAYSGYSGGFTASIKFAFIEGTPERNVYGIKRLWHGYFGYGDTTHHDSNNINVHFPMISTVAPDSAVSSELKMIVTGHGSDANGCCEFMPHSYYVYLNDFIIDSYYVWRPDCGLNDLYPQSGTWLYERSNWCPGAIVYSQHHKLHGYAGGDTAGVAIQFGPYASPGGGGYGVDGTLFFYGPVNKAVDASLDDIISPSNDSSHHFRENPFDGNPVIHVRNSGDSLITSMLIQYSVDCDSPSCLLSYTWTGALPSMQETDVTLPEPAGLRTASGVSGLHSFNAKILQVNGAPDDDSTNNSLSSRFVSAPSWPTSFRVYFKTNNEELATGSGICETSWQITDIHNNVVASRANAKTDSLYIDSVYLGPNVYKFQIFDTVNCDGLHWWVWDATPSAGVDAGYLNIRRTSGGQIPMNGYYYSGTYNNDFGCGFTQYFTTNWPTAVENITDPGGEMDVYPNPAADYVNIDLAGMQQANGTLQMTDVLGRVVRQLPCGATHMQLVTAGLAPGVYNILFIDAGSGTVLTKKLLINR